MELHIEGLSKTYPNGVCAVDDVTLHVPQGMFGLLGPNGAGKSTLMRILATLQEPDTGTATLGDIDMLTEKDRVRETLGYLPQEFGVYPKVRARDLLDHFAVLKGITNSKERKQIVDALLDQTNLTEARKQKLGSFSGGMRQRFGIAVALLGDPRLIIVDEPTAGLDPEERVRFLNLLSELGENSVVILSTHIVEDVSELCSRMAVISRGQILVEGDPARSIANLRGKIWEKSIAKDELDAYDERFNLISTRLQAGRRVIHVLADHQPDESFAGVEPDLEDVYFATMLHVGHSVAADEAEAARNIVSEEDTGTAV